jgi:serine/threonine protein kinase/outer membrane protein assembly factor BamB
MVAPAGPGDLPRVGEYTILGRLGRGGFGAVYVASPTGRPDELLAVKVLNPTFSENAGLRKRFLEKEIPGMRRVSSPYVPHLLTDSGDSDPLWFSTELVRGPSLQTAVAPRHEGESARPLPEAAVWRLGLGIAEALEAIHGAGLVHRDLKPGNVLLVPDGPRVIDFSLVHLSEMVDRHISYRVVMVTHGYAPVEQLDGLSNAGPPADMFALGATLVFAATGHPPFMDERETRRGNPRLAGLPGSALTEVVSSCLLGNPAARPQLRELKAEFSKQARRHGGRGGDDFDKFLPEPVIDVIRVWRYQLDEVTRTREQSRWDAPAADPWHAGSALPLPPTRQFVPGRGGGQRSGTGTRIQPGTGQPRLSRPGHRSVRWEHQLADWVRAPVVVGYHAAVAASLDGTVVCLSADTGQVLSKPNLGMAIQTASMIPFGALVGDAAGGVYAVQADSSRYTRLFHAPGGSAMRGCTSMLSDSVYMVSEDGGVWEINGHTLQHRLLHTMPGPALGPVTEASGTVFAVSSERVFAIDRTSGQVRWSCPVAGLVYTPLVVAMGTLYFAGTDGTLYSIGARARGKAESVRIGVPAHGAMACDLERRLLYVGGADGAVRAFDISGVYTKPVLQWTRGIGDEIGGITSQDGMLYCAADGKVVVLDGGNGTPGRWVNVGSVIVGAPTVYRNLVYVASLDGFVRCLAV